MFLILLFFYFLIALKALDGSLEIMALNVRFVLTWRDLIRSLDNFLLSLQSFSIVTEQDLVDLAILKFFLICDKRGHLGGFGGGGGRVITLLVAVAYLIRVSLMDKKKVSKRALDEDIVKLATKWSRIGDTFIAKSAAPLGVHLIRISVKSTVGAFDSLSGGFWGIDIWNLTNNALCLMSKSGGVRGHNC